MDCKRMPYRASEGVVHCVVNFFHPDEVKPVTEITAEIAATPCKRAVGLSKYPQLHPQAGMLFLNPNGPQERSETFHVGKCQFSFDLIFLRGDQKIGKLVHDIQPEDKSNWTYPKTAAVLEVCGGFCRARGIEVGDLVRIGSVKQAQSGRPDMGPAPQNCPGCGWPTSQGVHYSWCKLQKSKEKEAGPMSPVKPVPSAKPDEGSGHSPKVPGWKNPRTPKTSQALQICQSCGQPIELDLEQGSYEIPELGEVCETCMDDYIQGEEKQELEGQKSYDPLTSIVTASHE